MSVAWLLHIPPADARLITMGELGALGRLIDRSKRKRR
jgi:hypothetical protein